MLKSKLLLFSRTLTKDYRWLSCDDAISNDDVELLMSDYHEFEAQLAKHWQESHLVVRYLKNGIALYKCFDTGCIDQNARKIRALAGLFFTGLDGEIVHDLQKYIAPYFFFEESLVEVYQQKARDDIDNECVLIEWDLNTIVDSYRNNTDALKLSDLVASFKRQHVERNYVLLKSFVIAVDVDSEKPIDTLLKQSHIYSPKMPETQKNITTDQLGTKSSVRFPKTEFSCSDLIEIIFRKKQDHREEQ